MVCSVCGHQSPAGNLFCGMCGIPLPHRAMSTPGAQGTTNLTPGPLENSEFDERESTGAAEGPGVLQPYGDEIRSDAAAGETPRPDQAVLQGITSPSGDVFKPVPVLTEPREQPDQPADLPNSGPDSKDPLRVFAEKLELGVVNQPEEMATTGETLAMPSEVLDFANALPQIEPTTAAEAQHFPWMEDVMEQIESELAKSSEKRDEPPLPDVLDELSLPTFESNTPSDVVPSPDVMSPAPPIIADTGTRPDTRTRFDARTRYKEPPRAKWWMLPAVAAVLVFTVLGAMQWRAYRNNTTEDGPVEIFESKIQELMAGKQEGTDSNQAAKSADSETHASGSVPQSEEQSKPQDQSIAGNTSAPNGNPSAAQPKAVETVASQSQSPPPTASNSATGQQIGSGGKTQPSEQSSVAAYQPPTTTGSKPIVPQPAAQAAPSAIEKSKPVPQAKQDENQVAVKKTIRGDMEMAKAKNASDTAAKVAWLWKATAKGNPDAPLRLADLYIKGDIVPRSCEQAVVLLKTAAVNDNVRACNRLASMYAIGICVTRNHVKAYRWLSAALAADPNNEWAQQNRDLTWQQMTPEERALAEKYR